MIRLLRAQVYELIQQVDDEDLLDLVLRLLATYKKEGSKK